ncbi:MAG: hypothetical protein JST22_19055 [Bacteroidetes bacterium]|nr:hypothetical protein [Bacteroidota bacterium]
MKAQRIVATLLLGATVAAGTETFAAMDSAVTSAPATATARYQNPAGVKSEVRHRGQARQRRRLRRHRRHVRRVHRRHRLHRVHHRRHHT